MQLIDALIEAETQLDWGVNPNAIEQAINHLKAFSPDHALMRPLQMKLVQLRLGRELAEQTGRLPRV
jgi:hypothetical protein